ncbi:MAG: tetratricopeptide repeat protein, partial [Planctomycetes bacterium]|nr:tetratricopeptide repeat protein [Planctomycetota bacterium]
MDKYSFGEDFDLESGGDRLDRARALADEGRIDEALLLVEDVVATPGGREPEALGFLGELYRRKERWEDSIAPLKEAIALLSDRGDDPEHLADCLDELSDSYSRAGRLNLAILARRKVVDLDGNDMEARIELSCALERAGRFEAAIEEIDRALELDPDDAEALRVRCDVLAELGRFEEAEETSEHFLSKDPASALSWSTVAFLRKRRGKEEEAVEALHRALDLDPESSWAARELADHELSLNHVAEARRIFQPALDAAPDDANSQAFLGRLLRAEGRLRAAVTAYERALALDSTQTWVYQDLCEIYRELGDAAEARRTIERALRDEPRNPVHLGYLAEIQLDDGDEARAEETLRKALAIDAGYGWAARELSGILWEREAREEAMRILDRAIEL